MTWWAGAVGYEVYLRSFADGDGDGVGDFPGLTSRLGHLADLGVDLVWVTPFYPSPQADFGYDVTDHRDVDPTYGTLDDFDRFVAEAHRLDLRVAIDLVPNHTSSEHPWFRSAVEGGRGSPHRDLYVWRDPGPGGGPPNNWRSMFGGSAWTLDDASGQYYMHLFLPEQPDLNWRSPAVHDAFEEILAFWLDRGVDGFRVDVAHALYEHGSFADEAPAPDLPEGRVPVSFDDLEHRFVLDQPETIGVYRRWRDVVESHGAYLVGEVYLDPHEAVRPYVDDALHQAFHFGLHKHPWDPGWYATEVRKAAETIPTGWAWVQGSHDEHRAVTRYGGGDVGRQRHMALSVALLGLPGTPFIYQGEELGLENAVVAPEDVQDPVGRVRPEDGRDPCRSPMPWSPGPGQGFTDGSEAWLRSARRPPGDTVEVQSADPASPLARTRALLAARRRTAHLRVGPVRWMPAPAGVVAYARAGVAHVANLTDGWVEVLVGPGWVAEHAEGNAALDAGCLRLGPRAAAILRVGS
jgi:alpha-glucosidase